MNHYWFIAGILCIILGLAHSILGELLIFKSMRRPGNIVPTKSPEGLSEKHLRIIWASWHLASLLGWCIGIVIIGIAQDSSISTAQSDYFTHSISAGLIFSSLLVFIATKARHPGWVVLLIITLLLLLG